MKRPRTPSSRAPAFASISRRYAPCQLFVLRLLDEKGAKTCPSGRSIRWSRTFGRPKGRFVPVALDRKTIVERTSSCVEQGRCVWASNGARAGFASSTIGVTTCERGGDGWRTRQPQRESRLEQRWKDRSEAPTRRFPLQRTPEGSKERSVLRSRKRQSSPWHANKTYVRTNGDGYLTTRGQTSRSHVSPPRPRERKHFLVRTMVRSTFLPERPEVDVRSYLAFLGLG